jgi:hypothetical protein
MPDFIRRQRPRHFGSCEGALKFSRIRSRKISETIVQQNGDGLVRPRRRDDDIGKTVSVDVA